MKTVKINISEEDFRKFKIAAISEGIKIQDLVTKLIVEYLEEKRITKWNICLPCNPDFKELHDEACYMREYMKGEIAEEELNEIPEKELLCDGGGSCDGKTFTFIIESTKADAIRYAKELALKYGLEYCNVDICKDGYADNFLRCNSGDNTAPCLGKNLEVLEID